jgi:hypothetical protein
MTKDEALKLALEALEKTQSEGYNLPGTSIKEAITAIEQALADSALDRMAENARELGLDYEPAPVHHFDHASAANSALRDAQNRSYQIAKLSQPAPVQPVAAKDWEGAEYWMPLAWELCANECGEEACTELVWEGGPIPEPWGDRWLKYEDEAKRLIALVQKHTIPPAAQPAVPDAITDNSESPEYRTGWNDYRQAMMEMMK